MNRIHETHDPSDGRDRQPEASSTSSVQTRDAARLRSVMERAGESAPAVAEQNAHGSAHEPGAAETASAAHQRATTLRAPNANGRSLRSLLSDGSRTAAGSDTPTRLRTASQGATTAGSGIAPSAAAAPANSARPHIEEPAARTAVAGTPAARSVVASTPAPQPAVADTRAPRPAATAPQSDAPQSNASQPNASQPNAPQPNAPQPAHQRNGAASTPRPVSLPLSPSAAAPPQVSLYQPRRSFMRPALAVVAVVAGTMIGIGLYAGGADLIGGLFGSSEASATSDPNPTAVTERPLEPAIGDGAADTMMISALRDSVRVVDPLPRPRPAQTVDASAPRVGGTNGGHDTEAAASASTSTPAPAESVSRGDARPDARSTRPEPQSEPPATTAALQEIGTDAPGTSSEPSAGAVKKYVVQVRATPDEAEAKLIARRLKSKGATGVAVVPSKQKDGTTIYRIRYSAAGTASEAQSAANRAGYKNVWVVQQRK